MLLKILGGIDVAGALVLFLIGIGFEFGGVLLIFFSILFLIKSLLGFFQDLGSWIDLLTGLMFALTILFNLWFIFYLIFGALLIQKGTISFL